MAPAAGKTPESSSGSDDRQARLIAEGERIQEEYLIAAATDSWALSGLPRRWAALIEELPCAQDHAGLLRRQQVGIVLERLGLHLRPMVFAVYADSSVYVNAETLGMAAASLKVRGVPPGDIPELLALRTAPEIVHELNHALVVRALAAELGEAPDGSFVEDELLASYDEAEAGLALADRYPSFRDPKGAYLPINENTLKEWSAGPEGIRVYASSTHASHFALLETPREELLSRLGKVRRRFVVALSAMEAGSCRKWVKLDAEPDSLAEICQLMNNPIAVVQRQIDTYDSMIVAVSQPKSYGRLKDFYAARLREAPSRFKACSKFGGSAARNPPEGSKAAQFR